AVPRRWRVVARGHPLPRPEGGATHTGLRRRRCHPARAGPGGALGGFDGPRLLAAARPGDALANEPGPAEAGRVDGAAPQGGRAGRRHRVRAVRAGGGAVHLPARGATRLRGGAVPDVRVLRHLERREAPGRARDDPGVVGGLVAGGAVRHGRSGVAGHGLEALMRTLRIGLVLLAALASLALLGSAHAARIVIDAAEDPDSRLEIRTVTLPGGEEVQIYVLEGKGLR